MEKMLRIGKNKNQRERKRIKEKRLRGSSLIDEEKRKDFMNNVRMKVR